MCSLQNSRENQLKQPECCQKPSRKSYESKQDQLYHSRYTKLIIFIVMLGSMSCGINIYWEISFLLSYRPHLSYQLTFLLAITIGTITATMTLPYHGRRRLLIYSTLNFIPVFIISTLLQGLHAYDLLNRLLAGTAIGIFIPASIIYVSEIPLSIYRGRYSAILAFGYWLFPIVYAILFLENRLYSLALLIFPCLFIILGLIYLPETTCYVLQRSQENYAREILYFTRCGRLEFQHRDFECIKEFVTHSDCYHTGQSMRYRTLIVILLITFTHFTGFLFVIAISRGRIQSVFVLYGTETLAALLGLLGYYILVQYLRRSTILLISTLGTFFANVLFCLYFAMIPTKLILFITVALFSLSYFLGLASMFFLLIGECFPYKTKHIYVPFAVFGYFCGLFMSSFATREFCLSLGPLLTALYFAVHNLFAIIFAAFVMPNYKHTGFMNIQHYFDGEKYSKH